MKAKFFYIINLTEKSYGAFNIDNHAGYLNCIDLFTRRGDTIKMKSTADEAEVVAQISKYKKKRYKQLHLEYLRFSFMTKDEN